MVEVHLVVGAEALAAAILAVLVVEVLGVVILGVEALPMIGEVIFVIAIAFAIGAFAWIQRTKHLKDLPIHKE